MKPPVYLVISMSERVERLNELIKQILAEDRFKKYDIAVRFQDPLGTIDKFKYRDKCAVMDVVPELEGTYLSRINVLQSAVDAGYTSFLSMDDDMILTEHTEYVPALLKAKDPLVGFVMTNWAHARSIMDKKVPKMLNARATGKRFFKQILIYNGGGMAFDLHSARVLLNLPKVRALSDVVHPLALYMNGLTNYRDQGSLAVHTICMLGGMRTYRKKYQDKVPLMGIKFLRTRFSQKSGKWLIYSDSDVRPEAHAMHQQTKSMRIAGVPAIICLEDMFQGEIVTEIYAQREAGLCLKGL